ncbi:MAG: PDZ domain-containing protein [Syntrophomonadaceae bacterium]|nr:PDZ domain-containing protein [Syntrophomonadaceae bacterium]
MKRKTIISMIAVLVIGIMLGGGVVTYGSNLPFLRDILEVVEPSSSAESAYHTVASSGAAVVGPDNIADMVEKVSTSVVYIETTVNVTTNNPFFNDPFFREFFGDSEQTQTHVQTGMGTGSIISANGYILTNYHVVEGASTVSVKLVGSNDSLPAKVIGYDDELDLAVIKIEADHQLPVLALGNSDSTRVGEWVVAIGNPYGLDHTVTAGVISAKERPITIEGRGYKNLIQTDAAINPGNSGGPLLNTQGQVIAINTAVNVQAQGIGFAIPINTAKDVLDQLINQGKVTRPWVGVYLQDLSADMADYLGASSTQGSLVREIVAGSPASKSGIQKGDIILSIDGQKIKDSTTLTSTISKMKVGQKIKITILREKKELTLTVTLEQKP